MNLARLLTAHVLVGLGSFSEAHVDAKGGHNSIDMFQSFFLTCNIVWGSSQDLFILRVVICGVSEGRCTCKFADLGPFLIRV